jgi:hypothetical protein
VHKAGHRVRITAQLVDALSGAHLWADPTQSWFLLKRADSVLFVSGGTESSQTLRWRGMDSNFQFR